MKRAKSSTIIRSSLLATSCSMTLWATWHRLISASSSPTLSAHPSTCCLNWKWEERFVETWNDGRHQERSNFGIRQQLFTAPIVAMQTAKSPSSSDLGVALLQQCVLLSSRFQIPVQSVTVHTVNFQSGLCLDRNRKPCCYTIHWDIEQRVVGKHQASLKTRQACKRAAPVHPETVGLWLLLRGFSCFLQALWSERMSSLCVSLK